MDGSRISISNGHLNNFDIIRLIAATLVIITHSYSLTNKGESDFLSQATGGALMFSHLGVAIFFSISGYLITMSAFTNKTCKGYIWRRLLRIVPGLAIVLVLSAFVLGPIVSTLSTIDYFKNPATYRHLLSVFIYIQSNYSLPGVFMLNPINAVNGSLWTLAYEFSLYIIVLIALYAGLLKKKTFILCLWFVMMAVRIYVGKNYFVYSYSSPFLLNLNITYFFEWSFYFLSGMLVFLFKDSNFPNGKMSLGLLLIYIIFAVCGKSEVLRILNYITVPYILFYLSFIPGKLTTYGHWGDFSYGMYIYAFPVQQTIVFLYKNEISIPSLILLSICFTLPLAIASWHLVEKLALSYKHLLS
jgi:peptidoglycan/LPS O-acetylase OafA/YrhL